MRELRNFVERIVVLRQEQKIDKKCVYEEFYRKLFPSAREKATDNHPDLHKAVEYFERDFIKQVLNVCGNNPEDTARFLKILYFSALPVSKDRKGSLNDWWAAGDSNPAPID